MGKKTTIQIGMDTKHQLDALKLSDSETYNEVILNLIEDNLGLSQQAIQDLTAAIENVKNGDTVPHSQVKAMFGIE